MKADEVNVWFARLINMHTTSPYTTEILLASCAQSAQACVKIHCQTNTRIALRHETVRSGTRCGIHFRVP